MLINIFLYFMIFLMGSVFGSFFTLAVYRLPRKENITYVRSHCTSCNHKLDFWDLIPIWSYIFLGGKCRYCKEKIRARYILLEIFSGLVFLLTALNMKIDIYSTFAELINLSFIYLFFCSVFITGGIDKETYKVHNGTIIYGMIIGLVKLIYNIFMGLTIKYELIGLTIYPIILSCMNLDCFVGLKANEKDLPIGFGDIKFIATIGLFLGFGFQTISLLLAIIITVFSLLLKKISKKSLEKKEIPFCYYLSIATSIVIVCSPVFSDIAELINITMINF